MQHSILYFDNSLISQVGFQTLMQRLSNVCLEIFEGNEFDIIKSKLNSSFIIFVNSNTISKDNLNKIIQHAMLKKEIKIVILFCKKISILLKNAYLSLGVKGLVSYQSSLQDIIKCLECVRKQYIYIDRKVIDNSDKLLFVIEELTYKEMQIIELIIQGKKNKEIASILSNSVRTIESHRANVTSKLGIHGTGILKRYLMQNKNQILELLSIQNIKMTKNKKIRP